jgi:hypothetical protein
VTARFGVYTYLYSAPYNNGALYVENHQPERNPDFMRLERMSRAERSTVGCVATILVKARPRPRRHLGYSVDPFPVDSLGTVVLTRLSGRKIGPGQGYKWPIGAIPHHRFGDSVQPKEWYHPLSQGRALLEFRRLNSQ